MYWIRYFVQNLGLDRFMPDPPWLPRFAVRELGSVMGRFAPRVALAHRGIREGGPLLALFRAACQSSFAPGDASLIGETARACDAFDGDPLWRALARHVARMSTAEDRALLEDLARHPETREPPLSWGLQYYVRGDLMFDDDTVVTLDDLCAQAGLVPPPLLEDMPEELDIPLDSTSP